MNRPVPVIRHLPDLPHGGRYRCTLVSGKTVVLRFGTHRKDTSKHWRAPSPPPDAQPKVVWIGWREEKGNFVRPEDVVSYEHIVETPLRNVP